MNYYVWHKEQEHGPYPEEALRASIATGTFDLREMGREEDSEKWKSLSAIFGASTARPLRSAPVEPAAPHFADNEAPEPASEPAREQSRAALIALLILCGALLLLLTFQVFAANATLNKIASLADNSENAAYSYKVISPSDSTLEIELNEIGVQGWEIVSARRAVDSETTKARYEIILKKQVKRSQ